MMIPDKITRDEEDVLESALNKNTFIVDVRTPEEFSGGSAESAVNIPLDQVPERLDEFKDKNNIMVFCRSGNRSNKAKGILEENGIENVLNSGTWQFMDELIKRQK